MITIGKILLVIVLIGLIFTMLGTVLMRVLICSDIRQDPLFPFNPETSFDQWIAYKKMCRDPVDWLAPLFFISLLGFSLYQTMKKREAG